jgi:GNAT superfamily N-acetyltransferase
MVNPLEQSKHQGALPCPGMLETTARRAFSRFVRYYDEDDEVIVHVAPYHVRLIYLNRRASRQASRATFIQCRADEQEDCVWITSLQVSPDLQRQGLGSEMVSAVEATARAIGRSKILVCPLLTAVGFWNSLGFKPHQRMSRVLQKQVDRQLRAEP